MRCVLVNGARLKAETCCTWCGRQIGDSYIRQIGTRRRYCNYECFRSATKAPVVTLDYRPDLARSWTARS